MRGRFTTGVIIGSLIGASTAMLLDVDKKAVNKVKRQMNNMQSMFK